MDIRIFLPIILSFCGICFFFMLRKALMSPFKNLRIFAQEMKNGGTRRSFFLALAGTLGVGNIFGVAAGIMIGGAGSVFWLFVSGLIASVIKYAEVLLSYSEKRTESGGIHTVIESTFKKRGKLLSRLYASLCLLLSLAMGAFLQSASAADAAGFVSGAFRLFSTASLIAFVFVGIKSGGKKISKITGFVIPLTSLFYIILSFCVIIKHFSTIPDVIANIIFSAFEPLSLPGGIIAFMFSAAMREGFCRGMLSNEAGAGTSSLAHSDAKHTSAHSAGILGSFEVIFDTLILCTLTGIVILSSVSSPKKYDSSMALVIAAFSTIGDFFGYMIFPIVFLFAYSTVICWYYYGTKMRVYLFGDRFNGAYLLLFLVFILFGGMGECSASLYLTDLLLFGMTALTTATLFKNRKRIKELSVRRE